MLKGKFWIIKKFAVLVVLAAGLFYAVSFDTNPVKAVQCCTVCDSLSESCSNFCDSFPSHPHCRVCSQQVANCFKDCDPGC